MIKERLPKLPPRAAAVAAVGGAAVGYAVRGHRARRQLKRSETARRQAERENEQLRYEVSHDSLTGALTKEAIKSNAQELKNAGVPFGVFMMDWDAFKLINDELGHEKADEMLSSFGVYFARNFRREGESVAHERIFQQPEKAEGMDQLLGRYGGDEFVLLVNLSGRGQNDGLTPLERMAKAGQYLRSVTEGFVEQQDQAVRDLRYGISMGGTVCLPGSPMTVGDTFREADVALRLDKEARGAPAR